VTFSHDVFMRGGSWGVSSHACRSATRNHNASSDAFTCVGFRVVSPTPTILQIMKKVLRGGFARSALKCQLKPSFDVPGAGFRITTSTLTVSCKFVPLMVSIPAGQFLMGSPEGVGWEDEHPQHLVTLEGFEMSRTPITQAHWRVVAALPAVDRELNPDPSHFKGEDRPVECVSWYDAMEFCARLTVATGRTFTLPSEAQWEYACRAGTTTAFNCGHELLPHQANFDNTETSPVLRYPPNAWGLHDMHGNVWEWCLDDWHGNVWEWCLDDWHHSYEGAPTDGSAWVDEAGPGPSWTLLRGGFWHSPSSVVSSVRRLVESHLRVSMSYGFRIIRRILG
jgi:formylglycine-generating enzyme required for sulfatase activity